MTSSTLSIHQSAQKEQSEFVFVRSHYRRRPRRRPPVFDPITEKEVCRLFMLAMLQERERERIRKALVELSALSKRLHAYRQRFHIRLDNMPDAFSLFSRQHPDRPACRGAC